jgi:hypothetical protein
MRLKSYIFLFIIFLNFNSVYGQLSSGGQPVSYNAVIYPAIMHPVPMETKSAVMDQDKRILPLKFAYSFDVDYSCENDGEWFSLPGGGRLWRMRIRSEGAKSINIIFKKFWLPEGGRVFVYAPDRSTVLGAFTCQNNKPSGIFAVAPVPGDEIIVEYNDDGNVAEEPVLEIGSVNHDFLGVYGVMSDNLKVGWFGDSGECNVNVNCSKDKPDSISKAVCKIIVDGTMLCSGTIMNNTGKDGTPYFLTAAHCLRNDDSDKSILFYFNYETPVCIPFVEGTKDQILSGSTLKAQVDTLDFALVEMSEMPPPEYMPYWSGWNISTAPQAPFVTIHHPSGDVKKISVERDDIIATTFNAESVDGDPFVKDAHWHVKTWESGTTEGGSSGAGLFDAGNMLVGTLSGGEAMCGNSVNDYFARLNKMWDYLNGDTVQVAAWLDPDNKGVSSLEGLDYYGGKVKRLTHLLNTDTVVLDQTGITGYWTGHNSLGITEYAEKYTNLDSVIVKGVYVIFGKRDYGEDSVTVKIWEGDETGPSNVIAEKMVSVKQLAANKEHIVTFNGTVSVKNTFYAGIEIDYSSSDIDTVALYNIVKKDNSEETGYVFDGATWKKMSRLHPDGTKGNFWIDLLVSYGPTTGIGDDITKDDMVSVFPNPVVDGRFYYKTDKTGLRYIEVLNINGKSILFENVNPGDEPYVDIPGLASGIYLARFVFEKTAVAKKLLVK